MSEGYGSVVFGFSFISFFVEQADVCSGDYFGYVVGLRDDFFDDFVNLVQAYFCASFDDHWCDLPLRCFV